MARSDGHTNSAAATMELIRLIKTLNPKAARGFIAHLFDAAPPNVRSQDEPHNARFFAALRNVCFWHKADISDSKMLLCNGRIAPQKSFAYCALFPGIDCWGNGLDQTLPKTEIEQLNIRIHT